MSSNKAHGPIYILGPSIPTIAPQNFLLLLLWKKGGFWYYNNYSALPLHHLCLCMYLFNCLEAHSWHFGIRDALAFNFCSSTFYDMMEIQQLKILWELERNFSHLLSLSHIYCLKISLNLLFALSKSPELVRGALLPLRKSFSLFFPSHFLFYFFLFWAFSFLGPSNFTLSPYNL